MSETAFGPIAYLAGFGMMFGGTGCLVIGRWWETRLLGAVLTASGAVVWLAAIEIIIETTL